MIAAMNVETRTILVRDAEARDVAAIQAIYAHHVLEGLASFEEAPPGVAEIANRMQAVRALRLPWLVAERDGDVVGYAYAGLYRARSGYRYTLEDSVYVREGLGGGGIGEALLRALIERCSHGPWRQMIAVIGDSANVASIGLHRKLGFRPAGKLEAVGFKLGRWVDSVFMQRRLGDGETRLPD
jgi:L-amino acid N-acyltransferase YncA